MEIVDFDGMSNNRDVKMFTSPDGSKHIVLDGDGVIIQCNSGTTIQLGSEGVAIVTDEDIELVAGESISLESKKVVSIAAEEKIEIFGEDSFIELGPTEIKTYAEDIEMEELLVTEAEGVNAAQDARLTIRIIESSDEDGIRGAHGDFIRYRQEGAVGVGMHVRINEDAMNWATGERMSTWVNDEVFIVKQVRDSGNELLINQRVNGDEHVYSWIRREDVIIE